MYLNHRILADHQIKQILVDLKKTIHNKTGNPTESILNQAQEIDRYFDSKNFNRFLLLIQIQWSKGFYLHII